MNTWRSGIRRAGGKQEPPYRKSREISELLESLGHNPIEAMVHIATDPEASLEPRGRMNAELAQYVYPKRKAVEVAADQDAPPIHRVVVEMVRIPEVPRQ